MSTPVEYQRIKAELTILRTSLTAICDTATSGLIPVAAVRALIGDQS